MKSSSPKILPLCPALIHAIKSPKEILTNPTWRGRVVEAMVGAHLRRFPDTKIYYWRDGNDEVDYVLKHGDNVLGVEVKSGLQRNGNGPASLRAKFSKAKCVTLNEQLVTQLIEMPARAECRDWLFELGV